MTIRESPATVDWPREPMRERILTRPRRFGYLSLLATPIIAGALPARPLAGAG